VNKSTTNPLENPSAIPVKVRGAMQTTENDSDELLTGEAICQKLKIKKSFLYAPCRRKGPDAIPCIRIGKYLRYDLKSVREWINRQNQKRD